MDITLAVNSVNSVKPNHPNASPLFSAPKRNDIVKEIAPQAKNAEVDPTIIEQQVKDLTEPEKVRQDNVLKTVQSQTFRSHFALNNTTFSIFKDSSGQFVTRFTDRNTGKVTYIPEPAILEFMQHTAEQRAALVEVQA